MNAQQPRPTTSDDLSERIAVLEREVRELRDERELRELLSRYSFGADVYRGPDWVELFTPDGRYDLGSDNVEGAYTGRFDGAEQLLGLITGPGMPPEGGSQHHHGPVVFRVDGDEATAESYSITYRLDAAGAPEVYCLGFSRWRFRRVDGRWRIAERHRRELGAGADAEVISRPLAS
jgi:hypothetical protein